MPKGVYKRNPLLRPQTFIACKSCGVVFGPVQRLSTQYCSVKCKGKSMQGIISKKKGKSYPHLRRAKEKECIGCSSVFRAIKDTVNRKQLYCSHSCYLKHRRVSQFESNVFDSLESYGITVDRSVKIGKWVFDGKISCANILIEADGHYWHSSEVAIERDDRKNNWCVDNGYELFRIDELEYRANARVSLTPIIERWQNFTGKTATRA